nr:SDR family oxidoreductase [Arthrobacter psychrolactophilus]
MRFSLTEHGTPARVDALPPGADVAFTYLPEEDGDAAQTVQLIEDAGQSALALPDDLQDEGFCLEVAAQVVEQLSGIDVLVNNAGYQMAQPNGVEDITTDQLERTYRTNVFALFWLVKAALPHLRPGSSIINITSIQGYHPSPSLIDYASTKAAITSATFSLAQSLGGRGIRENAVAPEPIWPPPATQPTNRKDRGVRSGHAPLGGLASLPNSRAPMCSLLPLILPMYRAQSSG